MSDLKEKILEIAEIAKACPENLQVICFEVLLKDYLGSIPPKPARAHADEEPVKEAGQVEETGKALKLEDIGKGQDDLSDSDLHVKARKFLKQHSLTLGELNNLFYKENNQICPLYDDLKTTRLAEYQVRITLLCALRRGIQTGEFDCDVEEVRNECNDRKCYDRNNFGNNFTNNSGLFDFSKFNKSITKIRLSEEGKKELAELVRELQ